ncbi:preprotein translocase SecE subunit [Streptacidiphilus sp. MAP12-20]
MRYSSAPIRLALFGRQVVAELRKVVWPTRAQQQTYVYVVIVFVVAMMLLVYGLNWIFVKIVSHLFGRPDRYLIPS